MLNDTISPGWYAVQVRRNHERSVESGLGAKGYEVFLPAYSNADSCQSSRLLFPNYVFFRITSQSSPKILTTSGVVRVVGYGSKWGLIDDSEIASVRLVISAQAKCCGWRYPSVGSTVRIETGPLKGAEGILLDTEFRLIISITLLGRSLAVHLSADTVVSREATPLKGLCLSQPNRGLGSGGAYFRGIERGERAVSVKQRLGVGSRTLQ